MKIRGLGLSLIALSEKYTFILIVGTRVKSSFTPFKSNAGHVTPLNCWSQMSNGRRIGGRTFSKPEECKTFASE